MTLQRLFCVSVAVLTAAPALAEQHKKPMVDMQSVTIPAHQEAAPKTRGPAQPALTLDSFRSQQQGKIQALIDQQIVHLQRMIRLSSADDPQVPDYYFRLGELLTEKYRYWNNRARELDEAIYRAEHGGDTRAAAPEPQQH
jgi:hypothetical protein